MLKVLSEAIDNIDVLREHYQQENFLSSSASKILQYFKNHPEIRLASKKIQEETSLPLRTLTFSLKTLVDKGLIQKYGQGAATRAFA